MSLRFDPKVIDPKTGRRRVVVNFVKGHGRTKQSFKDQVNINKILARYRKSGMIDHVNRMAPFYGDVSNLVGYQEAIEKVRMAEDLFSSLSSDVRKRFENDPSKFIEFMSDSKNIKEAIELGICVERKEDIKKVLVVGEDGKAVVPAKPAGSPPGAAGAQP